jgi:hypothetical protein
MREAKADSLNCEGYSILAPILLLFLTPLVSGCVAAAAGAAAGDAAASPSDEAVEYVRTHDLEPYIGRAIERGDVVRGMSKEDVRFVMGEPRDVREQDGRTVWVYGTVTDRKRVYFENGKIAEHQF